MLKDASCMCTVTVEAENDTVASKSAFKIIHLRGYVTVIFRSLMG